MEKGILTDDQRNELGELKERFNVLIEQLEKLRKGKTHTRLRKRLRIRILGNPTMTSARYPVSLESLKERFRESRKEESRKD